MYNLSATNKLQNIMSNQTAQGLFHNNVSHDQGMRKCADSSAGVVDGARV